MGRWLVNSIPIWVLGPLLIGAFTLVAVGGLLLFLRSNIRHPENNWVASGFATVAGGLFGVTLAFVIVSLYQDYKNTESAVHAQATDLGQLVRLSGALPRSVDESIRAQVVKYVQEVRTHEWHTLRDGKLSVRAWDEVGGLYRTLEDYNPSTETQKTFYSQAVTKLDDVVAQRRVLASAANEGVPVILQALVFLAACVTIFALYLFSPWSTRIQVVVVAVAAAVVSSALVTATVLDYPFSRALPVSNASLQEQAVLSPYAQP